MAHTQLQRKVIGVPLQKGIDRTEQGFLLVRGCFTSDNQDEAGDVITKEATMRAIPKYRQWGNIRRMHQPDPVGKVTRIGAEDGLAWNEVEIMIIDPKACFEVENGLLKALSVGILVNVQDVTKTQDGGWVINDYQLAEISLVDHPANYDAHLLLNSLDDRARTIIREQGLVPALRSLGITTQGVDMDEMEKDIKDAIQVEEQSASEVASEAEQLVEEQPVAEVTPVVEEVPVEEAPAAEEQPVASVAEETAAAPEGDKSLEPSVSPETAVPEAAPVQKDMPMGGEDVMQTIKDCVAELRKCVADMQSCVSQMSAPKAAEPNVEKAPEVEVNKALDEQTPDKADPQEDLLKQIADLKAKVDELSAPVDRKGMLPIEELPEETPVAEEPVIEKPKDLRSALRKYVETRR